MLTAARARLMLSTLFVALGIAIPSSAVGDEIRTDLAYATEEVSFENDGLTLHGTVLVPTTPQSSADQRRSAVVVVAGSGPRPRSDYLEEARAFAAAGVVTLIYDKRTVGYTLTERSYDSWVKMRSPGFGCCSLAPMSTRRVSACGGTARADGSCRRQRRCIPRSDSSFSRGPVPCRPPR